MAIAPIGRPLIRVTEVDSTMNLVSSLADRGANSGTTVLAGFQSAGRGRAGRSWQADPWSSILLSFLHDTARPQPDLGLVAPALGLAVAETVDAWLPGLAVVKWPNDVLVDGRKLTGILVTSRTLPGIAGSRLIVGIGLNVKQTGSLPETATSISEVLGEPVSLDPVLDHLLDNVTRVLEGYERRDDDALVAAISDRLAWRHDLVSVADGERIHGGTLDGIELDGALRLREGSGELVRIFAGDLTRGPRRHRRS